MVNFKKIDDWYFVFVNKPLTVTEEKKFSDFLKARKSAVKAKRTQRTVSRRKKSVGIIQNAIALRLQHSI